MNGVRELVVRNGHLPERTILTGIGPVAVRQPSVKDRRPIEERELFSSKILPPYLRKTNSLEGLIPWLSLKGIRRSTPPLGLSATTSLANAEHAQSLRRPGYRNRLHNASLIHRAAAIALPAQFRFRRCHSGSIRQVTAHRDGRNRCLPQLASLVARGRPRTDRQRATDLRRVPRGTAGSIHRGTSG